jgi:hypothetical protein
MPKFPTFPTLYDECKKLSITDLKRLGFILPEQFKRGTINWTTNGNPSGSISITTDFTSGINPYLELDYSSNDKPIKYRVQFVSVPSNLGKGTIWYFRCPSTNKLCRKLYLVQGYFLHREAFKGCMYEKQTQSKRWRELENSPLGLEFKSDKLYEQLYRKHFKKMYDRKPTKKYLRLIQMKEELKRKMQVFSAL